MSLKNQRGKGEGSVYQRNGRWYGSVELPPVDGVRHRKTVSHKDKATMLDKLHDLKQKLRNGTIPTPTRTTVAQWLEHWLEHIVKPQVDPSTYRAYRSRATSQVIPSIGGTRLQKLTPTDVRRMETKILENHSTGTALNAYALLSRALKDAVREGVLGSAVTDRVAAPKVKRVERKPLTTVQARKVLLEPVTQANVPELARWSLALLLGMRQGECLGLRWEDVDLDAGTLTISWQLQRLPLKDDAAQDDPNRFDVPKSFEYLPLSGTFALVRPKTDRSQRPIPLPAPVLETLKSYAQVWVPNPWNLLWAREGGRPASSRDDLYAWYAALDRAGVKHTDAAGVEHMQLHAARHTTATLLLEAGVDAHVVAAILGHTKIETTRGYQSVSADLQREGLAKLGQITG